MPAHTIRSDEPAKRASRERLGVAAIAAGIISIVAVYLVLNATRARDSAKDLLPYQVLVSTLPEPDQRAFRAIREGLLAAEAERARRGAWPDTAPLGDGYRWTRLDQGVIVNYFGAPGDPAAPAWLLEIQEPEPGMLPDPAPVDDEHHRLPDGTMLHTYVWMHRYGTQVPIGFVRQPQNSGWLEVFATPPNPVYYNRR
ncbi:MAG TPA: hypothetical protein VKD69_19710 [Vicinamibacterales bacterium]|nr:hypothetical protein [Vicinamibacterales bacterium]